MNGGADWLPDEATLRRLERLALATRRVAGESGARPGGRRTPAADFVDHRPYSPGDDQRHIDWPAAARHDEVFVKVGHVPQAARVYLLLDTSASVAADPAKWRLARQVGAALGWLSLACGDRLVLQAFPPPAVGGRWGPASGSGQCADLLAHLGRLGPAAGAGTALGATVRRLADRATAGGLVAIISDLWLSDDLDVALAALPTGRWDVLVIHILGRAELEPDADGALELCDAETGDTLPLAVDGALRAAYRAALTARIERVRACVTGRGGEHVLVPADWPLERAITPFLRRRAPLGR